MSIQIGSGSGAKLQKTLTENEVKDGNDEPHLAILERVRVATGLNIKEWADDHGLNRIVVYHSAIGEGSRQIRVMLAGMIGKKPSEVWPKRCRRTKVLDDEAYQRMLAETTVAKPREQD